MEDKKKTVSADAPQDKLAEMEKQGQPLDDQRKQDFLAKGGQYSLFACDARNEKGETIPLPANTGTATYRVGKMDKSQVYEIVIPIPMLDNPVKSEKADLAKPIKIGFEWGGASAEQLKDAAAKVGDQSVRASDGGSGGLGSALAGGEGGSSGGFRNPSGDLASMRRDLARLKKYDFWVMVKFAQNPQEPQK
jgi:hypothetical protein